MPNSDCVFCKIVSGHLPCFKVYEDEHFLGFLDIHPLTRGNSLLIPKEHHRWVTDVPSFADYWQAAKNIALAIQEVTKAESISYLTLGYEVPHAHIRIIPRYPSDAHKNGIDIHSFIDISEEEMKKLSYEIFTTTNSRN